MATRPNPFENAEPQMPPVSSGDMRSRLDKVLPKDVRITPDRRWASELIKLVPQDLLEKATNFINTFPADVSKEELAHELLDEIKGRPRGILGASDPEIALDDCIAAVKSRHLPN